MGVSRLDELFAATKSHDEWFAYFGTLTFREFMRLFDQASERFPASSRDRETFERHLPMMTAFARKLLMAGHIMYPATEGERRGLIHMAETFFAWMSKLPNEEGRCKLTETWHATQDYCRSFGHSREVVFDILVGEKQFKDR
jgi:hypothetical protein